MPTEFKLPQLGEQVEKGVVLSVLVTKGDHVDRDDVVLELETDKATTEVPSTDAGTVEDVRVSEGDEIQSGDVIFTLAEDREEAKEKESEGEEASKEEPEAEPEPEEEAEAEPEPEPEPERRASRAKRPKLGEPVPASPSIRRFARELGVELSAVAGTGEGGRVSEEDIKSHVRSLIEEVSREKKQKEGELPDFSQWGEVEREAMNPIRRATAKNVSASWERVVHVTQHDDADVTELEQFRRRFSDEARQGTDEHEGAKLTVTAILVKVAAAALRRFPDFNASVDVERRELVRKKYVHVGVAVDTDQGLLVPVLRDVDQKGLVEVAAELSQKAKQARARKLSREELRGASFSITNLGGLGTTRFTPIVGWPQVAILSVGRLDTKPVWDGDEFQPRKILPLGITYDHRAVDGADAARFLRWIAEALENPMRLTME